MNNLVDITPIVLAVIALCTVLLTSFVIPKLKAKHPQEEIDKALNQLEVYKNVAMLACRMVEQLYPGMAQTKFNEAHAFMVDYLTKAGIKIDEDQITAAIESAVLEINKTLRNPASDEDKQKDEWVKNDEAPEEIEQKDCNPE